MKKRMTLLVTIITFFVLFGCGGGGGGSDPAPSNNATTYSISGTITSSGAGMSGVTVSLSGTSTATATTDASGNYSFAGLANGSYAVTPSKTGYTCTPANKAVTVNNANVSGVDFAGTVNQSGGANYYPKTLGSTWSYLETFGTGSTITENFTVVQFSTSAFSIRSTDTSGPGAGEYGIEDYVLLANGGWGMVKDSYYDASGTLLVSNLTSTIEFLPSKWDVGTHDTGTNGAGSWDITVVGFESVTVPAGTFNALKLDYSNGSYDAWFADGVGMVKESFYNPAVTRELTSYTIQ